MRESLKPVLIKFILAFLCFFTTANCFAQSDSITFVKTKWQKRKINRGVWLKTYHFKDSSLFKANENITIVEAKRLKKLKFDLAYSNKELINTSDFGIKNKAIAALNGTFFDIRKGGSVDYIRSDGQVINYSRLGKDSLRAAHQQSAILLNGNKVNIAKYDKTGNWEDKLKAEDVMVTGPLLRLNNVDEQLEDNLFNKTRHPRSILGITKNKVLLVTIDGRDKNSAGMSMLELQTIMRWLKANSAVNLDGGGSTTLWVKGEANNGIVNYPSDNKIWDRLGQRKVANAILVIEKN